MQKPICDDTSDSDDVCCARPVLLPVDRDASRAEVEKWWARDRAALVKCYATADALWNYIQTLDKGFAASRKP